MTVIVYALVILFYGGLFFLYWKLIASIAHKRKRNAWTWFFLSFVFTPFFAILLLLVFSEKDSESGEWRTESGERG